MPDIVTLILETNEVMIAQREGLKHEVARMKYRVPMIRVNNFDEFSWLIGDYYNYHLSTCNSSVGQLPPYEAKGRAKESLNQVYRRRGGDIVSAFNDARDGTNGGVRFILDSLAEQLKAESIERYIRDVFDRNVAPNSWSQKVEIMSQFIERYHNVLEPKIREQPPERYAHDYEQLIRAFVSGIQQTSSFFRRL